jgi:hypothetical protein
MEKQGTTNFLQEELYLCVVYVMLLSVPDCVTSNDKVNNEMERI